MKTLLVIPSVVKTGLAEPVAAGSHPRMDYGALADALRTRPEGRTDILDYASLEEGGQPLSVRLAQRFAGRDAALSILAFTRCKDYDAIFSNGENVGVPLALLMHALDGSRRSGHVCIGHRLSAGKKRVFFTRLKAHRGIDKMLVYAQAQRDFAEDVLGIPASQLSLIAFHADDHFWKAQPSDAVQPMQVCAAGLEWRDYPTLLSAAAELPEVSFKLAAASPWSKGRDETEGRAVPANVDVRRYDYAGLRALYAQSAVVAVPLYETDFQAGVTSILEAMSLSKPVIVTGTRGQTDVVIDGVNGLVVPPGDPQAWQEALTRLLSDASLRERLGRAGRRWLEEHATLDGWVGAVQNALESSIPLQSKPKAANPAPCF